MSATNYNIQQRVMALNWFSNMASNKFGTAEVLQKDLDSTLHGIFKDPAIVAMIGQWQLVWGPVVVEQGWDSNKYYHVATNAMYVAMQENYDGQGNNHYVVAVAGTNALSLYGWFVEDFKTDQMTLWKNVAPLTGLKKIPDALTEKTINQCLVAGADEPASPRVSRGTCVGVTTLLDMHWTPQDNSRISSFFKKIVHNGQEVSGQNLYDFLLEKFSASNRSDLLTVTGHSLGGALSASLALKLCELQSGADPLYNYWNPSKSITLTAMPTAGASPGNKTFSEYYGNKMGLKTNRVWNRMDPVPYGHEPHMLKYLPQLYYPYIIPDAGVYGFANYLLFNSYAGTLLTYKQGGFYTQLMPETSGMNGAYNSVSTPIPPALILRMGVDIFWRGVLGWMGVPKDTIDKIILVVNDILKVEGWLGIQGVLLELIYKALMKIPGLEKLVDSIMDAVKFIYNNTESLLSFLGQLGYQHVWAYPDLMNMTGFQKAIKKYMKEDTPHDDFEKMLRYAHEELKKLWEHIFTPDVLGRSGIRKLGA